MDALRNDYERILAGLKSEPFDLASDKYSGVFLPVPFDEYWASSPKVMLVGRETAGWNTNNGKNTMRRILNANGDGDTGKIVTEATERYQRHLEFRADGSLIKKSGSRFKQYFFRLARDLGVNPKALVYANLFAWDYNKKTAKDRPENELAEVVSMSNELLAAQIKHLKPDFIIFATGYDGVDPMIRSLFNDHFDGYENTAPVIPKKLWEFRAGGSTCFRIAHPRATHGHGEFRREVILRIKSHHGEP
ncbi:MULTISPECIES: hypothetical protein [unclassified Marinobacter]|uniref:hypothetical protein n=1 Tax=unclassified Marinobacter TaxID=83889 RepID=UPI001928D69F|nr:MULTISPECIES: hypothetical protein [unclassified Marinobacter]MBL3824108.1 hypothetical protein [Marinobacter sp. MC3]MBL3892800.1 hypothetical protein [Marinobacter sp. MW3]